MSGQTSLIDPAALLSARMKSYTQADRTRRVVGWVKHLCPPGSEIFTFCFLMEGVVHLGPHAWYWPFPRLYPVWLRMANIYCSLTGRLLVDGVPLTCFPITNTRVLTEHLVMQGKTKFPRLLCSTVARCLSSYSQNTSGTDRYTCAPFCVLWLGTGCSVSRLQPQEEG